MALTISRTILCALALMAAVVAPSRRPVWAQTNEIATIQRDLQAHYAAGRFQEGVPLARRIVELTGRVEGTNTKLYAQSLYQLGNLLSGVNAFDECESVLRQSAGLFSRFPEARTDLAQTKVVLASCLLYLGKRAEGIELMQVAAFELASLLGPQDPRAVVAMNNLAQALMMTGRAADAIPIYRRLIAGLGPAAKQTAQSRATLQVNLASALAERADYDGAIAALRDGVQAFRSIGNPDHPFLATALSNLGFVEQRQRLYAEAERNYREALGILERINGKHDPSYATALMNLAILASDTNKGDEAERLTREVIAVFEKALPPGHPKTAAAVNNLAALLSVGGKWGEAMLLYDRVNEAALRDVYEAAPGTGAAGTSYVLGLSPADFPGHLRAIYHAAPADPGRRAQAFELFQRSQSTQTAAAVSQMAARFAAGDGALAQLVREQQDVVQKRAALEANLLASLGRHHIDHDEPKAIRRSIETAVARMREVGAELRLKFPQYAALIRSEPVSIGDIQTVLQPDEALLGFIEVDNIPSLPTETFVWLVTRDTVRWLSVDIPRGTLYALVSTLRCGLDEATWSRDAQWHDFCSRETGVSRTREDNQARRPLPFKLATAAQLYNLLLAPLEADLRQVDGRWRSLLIVAPNGPLASLPLQVLATRPPTQPVSSEGADLGKVEWLGMRQAISILPSVASLKALRTLAKPSRATRPFVGFGNPLLTGPTGTDRSAWERQTCPQPAVVDPARTVGGQILASSAAKLFRGGLGNVDVIRQQVPLPETADEVCAVARSVGGSPEDINLGERATEERVKELSESGALGNARIVHFATHGLVSLETQMLGGEQAQPALLLTPPQTASPRDDGLLTASEVAGLTLDADWVILSACNTAAGEREGAESMSGLARAFFYAGARALLVSHWPVDSEATLALVTSTFATLKAEPRIGRAEAQRRAIAGLVNRGGRDAHPANWAPFVVVGEGGTGR